MVSPTHKPWKPPDPIWEKAHGVVVERLNNRHPHLMTYADAAAVTLDMLRELGWKVVEPDE